LKSEEFKAISTVDPSKIECHDVYANALNKFLEIFVSHAGESVDDVLSNGLCFVADVADLDRIVIFRVLVAKETTAGEIYRWDKALGGTVPLDDALKNLDITPTIRGWLSAMGKDECVSLRESEFKEGEASFLSPRDVKSILIVPVFIDRKLWGVVTFHDNINERDFDEDCTALLRSVARLCANTITKYKKTQSESQLVYSLKRRERMMGALNEAAVIFLSQYKETIEEMMTAGIWRIADVLDLDRVGVYRNFARPDGLHVSQVYRWDRKSGGTTSLTFDLTDVSYSEVVPRWEGFLGKGKIINSPAKSLPEAALLKSFGVVSVFIVPLFIHSVFWGFVMLEDRNKERYFDDDSTDVMKSAAFLCANTFITYEQAQNEKKRAEALKRSEREAITLNEMSTILLSHENEAFEDIMNMGIKPVSDAAGIDRVAVYRLLDRDSSRFGQVYLWRGKTIPLEDELLVLPDIEPVERWVKILSKGSCINANVSEMPKDEAAFLSTFGVKGIFFVPIITNGVLWGAITFEDHTNYRHFEIGTLDFLRSAAHLCAGAIVKAEMERDIAAKNKLLATLNQISALILQSDIDSFGTAMYQCLGLLAVVMKVDRVCIWKNHVMDDQLYCTLVYEWSEGVEAQFGTKFTIDKSYSESLPGWEEILSQGKFINNLVRSLPAVWQEQFSPQGIMSILIVPVFLQNGFWGFVGFDDCHKERIIMQSEETTLRSATHLISNALLRNEEAVKAREADERARLMLDATPMSCHLWDEDVNIIDCNLEAVKLFGLESKDEYIDKYFDLSPTYQFDEKLSSEKAVDLVKKALVTGRCEYQWMHQKLDGEPIPTEKTLVKVDIGGGRPGIASYTRDLRAAKEAEAKIKEANARNQIMFDAMPLGCILWSAQGKLIDCNDEVLKLFEISSKQIFLERFFELSPDYQPNGSPSTEVILKLIPYTLHHGKVGFEWLHQKLNGDLIPTDVNLIKTRYGNAQIVVAYMRDMRELKEQTAKLDLAEKLAFSDSLTGIHNRRSFLQSVTRDFSLLKSSSSPIGIIMFDIDFFKQVNDTYGHECGDEALKVVAESALSVLRESDLLARYGGEEFVVLVQNLNLSNLAKLAERILKKIESAEFVYAGKKIPITVSAGVAIRKDATQGHKEVIRNADVALYKAKENGRNRVEVFSE
jgi:diguanylate cyclase (GGDEF)-like protein